MARRTSISDSGVTQIVKQLEKSNDEQQVIADTLVGFNPVLASPIVYDVIDNLQAYMALTATNLTDIATWMSDTYDELLKGSIVEKLDNIFEELTGNKMQEEENRREMIEALANIGAGGSPGNIPPPLPANPEEGIGGPIRAGISAGITQVIASRIAAMIPQSVKAMFVPLTAFFGNFLKFGKMLVKFAGPIGIAISVITGLIGAIKGGIEGYKEGGVEGAIKGALIGAIDGLIGTLVRGIADAVGWLLKAIGLKEIGNALGPAVAGLFNGIYENIKGFIDIIVGVFTLDSDKVIGGIKKIITGSLGNLKILGSLLVTMVKELVPLIWKAIKFTLWDLPKFLSEMLMKGLDFLWNDFPGIFSEGMSKLSGFIDELMLKMVTDLWPWLQEKFVSLLDSLSVTLTNLLGGVFTWLGGVLNWEKVSETVSDTVDFVDRLGKTIWNFIEGIGNSIIDFFQNPGEMLSNAWGSWVEYRNELYKKILAKILPQRTDDTSWSDPMHWVAKAIPDSVYKFAGLPTEVGAGLNDATGGVNPYDQKAKAMEAGYSSWDDYKNSGWKWKGPTMEAAPSGSGAMLNETLGTLNNAPIIINQMGGNVTNTTTSQVNNNTSPFEPIMAGSSLGFVSL